MREPVMVRSALICIEVPSVVIHSDVESRVRHPESRHTNSIDESNSSGML